MVISLQKTFDTLDKVGGEVTCEKDVLAQGSNLFVEFLEGLDSNDIDSVEAREAGLFEAILAFEDLNLYTKEGDKTKTKTNLQPDETTLNLKGLERVPDKETYQSTLMQGSSLKSDLAKRSLHLYRSYLQQLEKLDQTITEVESSLAVSSKRCSEIGETIMTKYEKALYFSKSLSELEVLSKTNETRRAEVQAFLDKYTLPQQDMDQLLDPSQPVDQSFLDVTYKLRELELETVGLKNQGETLGQDILNALIACRSAADYRLEEYLYSRLKMDGQFTSGSLEPDSLIQQAVLALGPKNKKWVNDLVYARLEHLRETFLFALTQGPNPMDLYMTDPCRYVGDMLTWVHQLIVEEKLFYFSIFSIQVSEDSTTVSLPIKQSEIRTTIYEMDYPVSMRLPFVFTSLNRSVQGVLELLSERIQHVMHDLEGPGLAFQISKSIQIHGDLFIKKLDINSLYSSPKFNPPSLPPSLASDPELNPELHSSPNETIFKIVDFAQEAFYQILEDDMAQLLATTDLPPDDLNVPSSVQSALNDLIKIISHPEIQDPGRVISTVLNPLIQLCDRDASFVATNESAIYVVNFLSYIQSTLSSYDSASSHIIAFTHVINRNLDLLVDLEHEALMKLTNLDQLMPITDAYHSLLSNIMNEDGNENSIVEFMESCIDQHLHLIISGLKQIEQFLYTVDLEQDFTNLDSNDDGDVIGLKRLKLPTNQVWGLRNQALKLLVTSYCSFYPLADRIFSYAKTLSHKGDSIDVLLKLRLRPVAELETLLGL